MRDAAAAAATAAAAASSAQFNYGTPMTE